MEEIVDKILFHVETIERRQPHDKGIRVPLPDPLLQPVPVEPIGMEPLGSDRRVFILAIGIVKNIDGGDEHQLLGGNLGYVFLCPKTSSISAWGAVLARYFSARMPA